MSVKKFRPLMPSDLQPSIMPLAVPTVPLAAPIPALAGTGPSHAAHPLVSADVALAGQEGKAEGNH